MIIRIALFIAGLVIGGILAIRVYNPLNKRRKENPQLPFLLGTLIRLEHNLSPILTELMAWLNCPIETEEQLLGSVHCRTIPWGEENAVVDWLSRPQGGLTITMDRTDIPKKLAVFHKNLRTMYDEMKAMPLFSDKYPHILSSTSNILDFTTACHQIISVRTANAPVILATYLEILGCNVAQLLRDIRVLQESHGDTEPRYWQPPP